MLHPRLFHKSDDLTVIFDVKFNSVNICWSRKNYDQYLSSKDITDEVCQGVSVTSGSISSRKATLNWKDPCDGLPPGSILKICSSIHVHYTTLQAYIHDRFHYAKN